MYRCVMRGFLAYNAVLVETNTCREHSRKHSIYSIYNMCILISKQRYLINASRSRKESTKISFPGFLGAKLTPTGTGNEIK